MLERARSNPKIKMFPNTVVEDVYDANQHLVTGVKLRNLLTDEIWERDVDGFFVAIGHIPNTAPFVGQIDLDPDGYIISHGGARTNLTGVFHAGDVQSGLGRIGLGSRAGLKRVDQAASFFLRITSSAI